MGLLSAVEVVGMVVLQVFVQLIFGREAFSAAGHRAWEVSSFCMALNVSLELSLVVEECRAEIASVFTARRDLSLDGDPVRAQMVVQLGHRVEFLRTLTADILLDFMMSLHVVVQVRYLGKGPAAIHLDANEGPFSCVQSSVVV